MKDVKKMKKNVILILFFTIVLCCCFISQTNAYYGLFGMGPYGLYGGLYGLGPFGNYGGLIMTPHMFTNIGIDSLLMPHGYGTTSATTMFPHISAVDMNLLNVMNLSMGGPGLSLLSLLGEQYGINLGYGALPYGGFGYGALGMLNPLLGNMGFLGGLYGGGLGMLGGIYGGLGLLGGLYGGNLGLFGGLYGINLGVPETTE